MAPLRTFVKTHATLTYFVMTFTISWGGVLLVIGGFAGMSATTATGDPRFVYALVAMLAGPALSGLLLTFLCDRRNGLRELVSRVCKWRVAARWYLAALLTAPLLWMATTFVLSLGASPFLSGILTSPNKAGRVQIGLTVALAAGVFEELGWTGFAIPHLRRRHGVFATGLIVGVLWGAWHLLTNVFWSGRMSAGELSLSVFLPASAVGAVVGYLPAFRVLMVSVYNRTRSVCIAMLMHLSLTASVLILDPEQLTGTPLLTYSFALAAVVWTVAAVITLFRGQRLQSRTLRPRAA